MNKLLSAEFARLCQSFVFKLGLFFSAGLGIFSVAMRWMDVREHPQIYAEAGAEYSSADGLIFAGGLYLIFAAAVLIGIFIGTEYGDGTIRNKLAVGHRRKNIYLSKLLACWFASLLIHLLYIVVSLAMGSLLFGGTAMEGKEICLFTAAGTAAMMAFASILLLISMSVQSKAAGSVACLLFTMIMLFSSLTVSQMLDAPEYHDGYAYMDEDTGEITVGEEERNPRYLSGNKRKAYEFFNDFMPVSQLYQIARNDAGHFGRMMGYDCLMIFVTAGAGIFIFQKKDLK